VQESKTQLSQKVTAQTANFNNLLGGKKQEEPVEKPETAEAEGSKPDRVTFSIHNMAEFTHEELQTVIVKYVSEFDKLKIKALE